jgi:hypothetical protein
MGAPYALSSDLVSAWPAKSLEVAQYIDGDVPLLAMPQNTQTGVTYSLIAADVTKLVTLNNAGAVAVTLPLEASVPWATSTQLRLLNLGAGTVTVAGAVGVTINGTPLTLAQYKGANLIKTGTDVWTFIPFASGTPLLTAADVSATTGSPSIVTAGGFTLYTWTASGSITFAIDGLCDVFIVGGGGGGVNDGGGGGGVLATQAFYPSGTKTITIGGGGTAQRSGSPSMVFPYAAPGGGTANQNGGCGGGGASPGSGLDGFGFGGASGGGGGGAGAAGAGSTGGAGKTSTLGSGVTKGAGASLSTSAPAANTGGGGGAPSGISQAGGSGYIEIRVVA